VLNEDSFYSVIKFLHMAASVREPVQSHYHSRYKSLHSTIHWKL